MLFRVQPDRGLGVAHGGAEILVRKSVHALPVTEVRVTAAKIRRLFVQLASEFELPVVAVQPRQIADRDQVARFLAQRDLVGKLGGLSIRNIPVEGAKICPQV